MAAINASGYEARLPEPATDALAEDVAREASQRAEYREFLVKSLTALVQGIAAMVLPMPLMGSADHAGHATADPLQRWAMAFIDPSCAAYGPRSTSSRAPGWCRRCWAWTIVTISAGR